MYSQRNSSSGSALRNHPCEGAEQVCLGRGRTVFAAVAVIVSAKPLLLGWPFRVPGWGIYTPYQPTGGCRLLGERSHGSSSWPRAVPGEGLVWGRGTALPAAMGASAPSRSRLRTVYHTIHYSPPPCNARSHLFYITPPWSRFSCLLDPGVLFSWGNLGKRKLSGAHCRHHSCRWYL